MTASGVQPTRWHELKTDPAAFDATAAGLKTMEIRLNDRDYQPGDGLRLYRTRHTGEEMRTLGLPLEFVGESIERVVTHVLKGPAYGVASDWVVMSVAPLDEAPHRGVAEAVRKLSAALGHPSHVLAGDGQSTEAALIDMATLRIEQATRATGAPTPETSGVGQWCAPGPQATQKPYWLLVFEDQDRGWCRYDDEESARRHFASAEAHGWNCYLFSPTLRVAAASITPAQQAVLDAASQWTCERAINDWDEANLMKAVFRLEGDWPGCPECDHPKCAERCRPTAVEAMLRRVDLRLADLIHVGKLSAPVGYTPPEGWNAAPGRKRWTERRARGTDA